MSKETDTFILNFIEIPAKNQGNDRSFNLIVKIIARKLKFNKKIPLFDKAGDKRNKQLRVFFEDLFERWSLDYDVRCDLWIFNYVKHIL